jgi:site-specific DNA-methyltransferase (adenine-specific)/modification methylase
MTELSSIYKESDVVIYNLNCLEALKSFDDKSFDLVVTSPPYNMRTRVLNGKYTTRERTKHFCKKYAFFDDAIPINEFYDFHLNVLKELLRVSKVVCYNFQIVTGSKEAFLKIIGDFNRDIKDIIIWDKGSGQPAMHANVLNSCYEMILVMEDDKKLGRVIQNSKFKRGEMNNILRIGKGKKINENHGAIFPEELPHILINAFSNANDKILDPFMGSGTTGVICKRLGRKFTGIEISEEYCNIAIDRLIIENNTIFKINI